MSAVGSLIGGVGDLFAAADYGKEVSLYQNAEEFTKESTALKQVAANREIFQGMGATRAAEAGSGFKASGSGLDLLRSSAMFGSLRKSQIAIQGSIEENNLAAAAAGASAQETSQYFGAASGIASAGLSGGESAEAGGSALDILAGG